MKFSIFYLILALFFTVGCNKPDPEAYRADPILKDYQAQLAATNAELESLRKEIESTKKEMNTSPPQTGQKAQHTKKFYDMSSRMQSLEQQVRYWQIRIESRAKEAQLEYLASHAEKKPWPDQVKVEAYYSGKCLRQAKIKWDHKERLEEHKKSIQGPQNTAPPAH